MPRVETTTTVTVDSGWKVPLLSKKNKALNKDLRLFKPILTICLSIAPHQFDEFERKLLKLISLNTIGAPFSLNSSYPDAILTYIFSST